MIVGGEIEENAETRKRPNQTYRGSILLRVMSITLDSALEDVEARFLFNLPESELSQPDRLFFQIEQAWWYYEDFKADRYPHLPHFSKLQLFAKKVFAHCPLLRPYENDCEELFEDFSRYKSMIPVYGVIMLSPDTKKMVLVCSYKGNSWGFPRGKVNQNEPPLTAAVREALEETGFDATAHCKQENSLVYIEGQKKVTLYIAQNVPEDTRFETQTRKEISKISFFPINALPKSTYGVYPFMQKLQRWIDGERRKSKGGKVAKGSKASASTGTGTGAAKRSHHQGESAIFDGRNHDTFADELAMGAKGWAVEDMFSANAKLTGRDYAAYSGNSHDFGSSHPRYVNFNETGGGGQEQTAGPASTASAMAVQQKQASRGGGGASAGTKVGASSIKVLARPPPVPSASVSSSVSSSSSSSAAAAASVAKWPHFTRRPFVMDRAAVLGALDATLEQTSSLAFAGAVF